MKLIICEKPAQAREYVSVFEKFTNSKFTKETGYYTNGEYYISNAIGHLVQLAPAEMYNPDYKSWKVEHLPIIPNPFQLVVAEETKFQFAILKKLISQAKTIYNATDAEREGELIFRYILEMANLNLIDKTIKRLWVTDYQYQTIVNAFEKAKDQFEYDTLYHAAKARSQSDWLIGINSTRMLTAASKANATLSLGRVQTAVLRLIVDRYIKNKNFVVEDLFTPCVFIDELALELVFNENYRVKSDAEKVKDQTKDKYKIESENKKVEIKQPALFSLVDLQVLCSKKFNYNASKTLELAQALYEKKLISYPRTDSNYLTEALKEPVITSLSFFQKKHFQNFTKEVPEKHFVSDKQNHFIFNDKKTSDHYAIIPLIHDSKDFERLDQDETNVFNEIIKRFMQCFMNKAVQVQLSYKLFPFENNQENFYQNKLSKYEYKGFYLLESDDFFNDDELIPVQDKEYVISKKDIKLGKTKPVDLFTEATLLKAMKNPLYYEVIEENRDSIKSLGTPATNDKFLPILMKRNYVVFQKKYIVPTELGSELINKLIQTKITSIALTAQIEFEIENIRNGKLPYAKFMAAMNAYTNQLTNEIKEAAPLIGIKVVESDKQRIGCPSCKKGVLYTATSNKNMYCSEYKNQDAPCNFILFLNIAGTKLTESDVTNLVTKGITGTKSFTSSKSNEKFKAKIKFDSEFKTVFAFEESDKTKKPAAKGKAKSSGSKSNFKQRTNKEE
jgi:DNA topoisomerase III